MLELTEENLNLKATLIRENASTQSRPTGKNPWKGSEPIPAPVAKKPGGNLAALAGRWKARTKDAVLDLTIDKDGRITYTVGVLIGNGKFDGIIGVTSIRKSKDDRFVAELNGSTVELTLSDDGKSLNVDGAKLKATLTKD